MDLLLIAVFTIIAYLIGAIPTTILIGKLKYGIDIREHGNGKPTHSNITRVIGPFPGIISRVVSGSKGLVAAEMAYILHLNTGMFTENAVPFLMLTFGLAALLGHVFSVFSAWKGGTGIHVTFGLLLAVQPGITLICAGIAVLILLISRYENLGYVTGALAFPLVFYFIRPLDNTYMLLPVIVFGIILFLTTFIAFRWNMVNILLGRESKTIPIRIRKRRKNKSLKV